MPLQSQTRSDNVNTVSAQILARGVRHVCAAVIMIMGLSHCGGSQDVSTVQHDEDRPVRGSDGWMWRGISESEYDSHLAPLVGLSNSTFLPESHALVRRTQFWLDQLDESVRRQHPAEMANVPRPKARVIKDLSANAFVAPVPVCYAVPVAVRPGSGSSASTVDAVYLDVSSGEVSSWPAGYECLNGTQGLTAVQAMVRRFNHSSDGCKLDLNGNGQLVPGNGCAIADDIAGVTRARNVVILQTAGFVTVHTGLFAAMSEKAFVAVLAHELGHYYRSHINAGKSEYDYYYTMQQDQPTGKPVAEPGRRELGEGAVLSTTLLSSTDMHRSFSGQKLRPELFFLAGSVAKKACAGGACSQACKDLVSHMDSPAFQSGIQKYPFGAESPGQGTAYAGFESRALQCLDTVRVAAGSGAVSADRAGWDAVRKLAESPVWPSWPAQTGASTQRYLAKLYKLTAVRMGQSAESGKLGEALLKASAAMNKQDDESEALLREANETRLGYYTAEQEADDVAAEWVSEIGIGPEHVVDAMRRLGRGEANGLRGYLVGESDCDKLQRRGWRDESGNYVFVPIGDYTDTHHSSCFRMFNLEREIAAHGFRAADVTLPTPPGGSWTSMQNTASGLGEPEVIGGGMHPILRKTHLSSCVWSQNLL